MSGDVTCRAWPAPAPGQTQSRTRVYMRLLAIHLQLASNSPRKCLESFSIIMKVLIALVALCAAAAASPVAPVLVPKVQVTPPQVTVVKQPYVFTEPEPVYRSVPVPIKAVSYTAPAVVPGPVIAPAHPVAYPAPAHAVAYAAPAPAVAYAAPGLTYAAPAAHYIY